MLKKDSKKIEEEYYATKNKGKLHSLLANTFYPYILGGILVIGFLLTPYNLKIKTTNAPRIQITEQEAEAGIVEEAKYMKALLTTDEYKKGEYIVWALNQFANNIYEHVKELHEEGMLDKVVRHIGLITFVLKRMGKKKYLHGIIIILFL